MTVVKGLALSLTVALAGTLIEASGPASGTTMPGVHLKAITSKVNNKGASLVIEATEPVPYVATRPDPLTVLIEVRNATAEGVANSVAANAKSPIAAVSVEPADAASRIRVTLTHPVVHRVRAERNTIVVEFDKPSSKAAPFIARPVVSATPDAMQALDGRAEVDPLAALDLDNSAASADTAAVQPEMRKPTTPHSASQPTRPAQSAAKSPVPVKTPTQSAAEANGAGTGRKFTGHPISLDFQAADLRAVLRTFAEISGLNIVIDPAVQGTVDVALRDVPWDQALDIILRANKLGYLVDGTIVRIAPLAVLADEETQRRKLTDEQALAGELHVLTKTLSYAKAEELKELLTKSALSPRGTVQVDARTNTLIMTDLSERLTTASDLITTLDTPQPAVEIEARIVQTNKNYARALGIQWGFSGRVDPQLGNTTNLAFPNSGMVGGRVGGQQGQTVGGATTGVQPTAVNLPVTGAASAVGVQLGAVNGAFNLDVALSALETSGNGRLLSTPRVTMQNNVEAEITQGVQIPIQTVANNTVTVTFKDAALTLKVTPQITSANTVIMKISVENASPDFSRAVNNIPPINTQRANTQVLVKDGQTTVIGGIYVSQEQSATDRTPGIGRVPLLGWLFKRDSINDQSTELLIFITPRIIKGNG